jgi:hypothetical protein
MNIGAQPLRAKLRLTIHRGGVGQRPNRPSQTLPVAANNVITSGMLITQDNVSGSLQWVKGVTEGSLPNQFFFALDDSNDGDVLAAGNLQGLSVRGDYNLSTSAYKAVGGANVYTVGTLLTPDGSTGNVRAVISGDEDVVVVGVVTHELAGVVDLSAGFVDGSLEPDGDANISDGVQGGVFRLARATNAADLTRLRFDTVAPYLTTVA